MQYCSKLNSKFSVQSDGSSTMFCAPNYDVPIAVQILHQGNYGDLDSLAAQYIQCTKFLGAHVIHT